MKRMVLIPEERLLRYEQRDKENVKGIMYGGGVREKEEAVRGIPKSMKKGAQVLLSRLKEKADDNDSEEKQGDSLTTEMIVRGIPKTMKTRAQALLAHLKERKDVITWDNSGQVTLKGDFIPKSNISDLISDAMRPRKHFNPVGVRKFYNVLNEINVPKDLVRNEKRWSEVSIEKIKNKRMETKSGVKRKRKQNGSGGWAWWKDGVKFGNQKGGAWIETESSVKRNRNKSNQKKEDGKTWNR